MSTRNLYSINQTGLCRRVVLLAIATVPVLFAGFSSLSGQVYNGQSAEIVRLGGSQVGGTQDPLAAPPGAPPPPPALPAALPVNNPVTPAPLPLPPPTAQQLENSQAGDISALNVINAQRVANGQVALTSVPAGFTATTIYNSGVDLTAAPAINRGVENLTRLNTIRQSEGLLPLTASEAKKLARINAVRIQQKLAPLTSLPAGVTSGKPTGTLTPQQKLINLNATRNAEGLAPVTSLPTGNGSSHPKASGALPQSKVSAQKPGA